MHDLLRGTRVLDLTRVWSGPLAGRILADLGAEVIQIVGRVTVSSNRPQPAVAEIMGVFPGNDPGERPWNRMSQANDFNRNKLGLALELDTPEGIDIFKRLVRISDVVLENFSPRVMSNFGLDYPVLKEINPGLIMCSMPGYGLTGPYRDYISYGTNLDPAAGLASLMGYAGEEAHMSGNAYPDPVAALHAVGAILTALFHKHRSGAGQHIDLSQAESAMCLIGEAILGTCLNGRVPERIGNRHPVYAPHGCYRCQGEDRWVAVAVSSEEEWQALAGVLGRPDLVEDPSYADKHKRRENQDELDKIIESWTARHTHHGAMERLQKAGVPAGAVLDAAELLTDEHLQGRHFFMEIDHPEVGPKAYCCLPIKFSRPAVSAGRPAPCLGEHNEFVLSELLGLSKEAIARLEEKGIIGTEPID
jgi:crotonobetainyl-CoA:carnitine CoA-transferase CaiB-like acyl-CoA transferase